MPPRIPEALSTPEEVAIGFWGGKKFGEAVLAEYVLNGKIPVGDVRRIIGVNPDGTLIYEVKLDPNADEMIAFLPRGALDPLGGLRHRP